MNKLDLTDTYRIFQSRGREILVFSEVYRNFSKINYVIEHRLSLNIYIHTYMHTDIETSIPFVLPDHNGINLKINKKETNIWRMNNTFFK